MSHLDMNRSEEIAQEREDLRAEEIERRANGHSTRIYAALDVIDKDAAPALADAIFEYCDKWAEADLKKDEASYGN